MVAQHKISKSYRQRPEVARMIEIAAAELGMSEADLVDRCIIEELGNVLRAELGKPSALPSLIKEADALRAKAAQSPEQALIEARERLKKHRGKS